RRQLCTVCHLGRLVCRGSSRFHGDELPPGKMASAEAFPACPVDRYSPQPGAVGQLQVPAGNCCRHAFLLAGEVCPPCSASRDLVLDLPGYELSLRSLPRRGTRSVLRGVRALHGVLSGGHLRADLSHARNAAAISLGGPATTERHRAWTQPHRHGRVDDAVGPNAGTGNSGRRRRRDQRWFRSPHALEWRGRLVSGFWIWIAAFLRFRWLLAHRHRRRQNAGLYPAGELCPSLPIRNAVDLLDALAHVALVLDSRLCFSPVGRFAPRDVVAKFRAHRFDGRIRTVA